MHFLEVGQEVFRLDLMLTRAGRVHLTHTVRSIPCGPPGHPAPPRGGSCSRCHMASAGKVCLHLGVAVGGSPRGWRPATGIAGAASHGKQSPPQSSSPYSPMFFSMWYYQNFKFCQCLGCPGAVYSNFTLDLTSSEVEHVFVGLRAIDLPVRVQFTLLV